MMTTGTPLSMLAMTQNPFAKPVQHEEELSRLVELLQRENVRSYLEVGVERGGTFRRVMMALPKGSYGLMVDLPDTSVDGFSRKVLRAVFYELTAAGRHIGMVAGDSQSERVVREVSYHGPFDAVLIDGDHSYAAVKDDFKNYGPMARLLVFHDIASEGSAIDVARFWNEIKHHYRHEEIIHTGGALMGLGILYMR